MDATAELTSLVARPDDAIDLERAVLLVAAHARPDLDLAVPSSHLDEIADRCDRTDLDALRRHLCEVERFTGNAADYYDPDNSFLDQVLERRTGIPLSLALVMVLVGRRVGLDLGVVGMPGHVLVRDLAGPPGGRIFVDAFNGGVDLDAGGAQRLFATLHGDGAPFDVDYLDAIGPTGVLARMLANLDGIYRSRGDRASLTWVRRLRASFPAAGDRAHAALASALAADGRFDEAADELTALAATAAGDQAQEWTTTATRLRARLN